MKITELARLVHEVNRSYCQAIGDDSQPTWADAPDWQTQSAVTSVKFRLENPHTQPSYQHEEWLKTKEADGWKYGPVKDPAKKEHPCFVPYDKLPLDQGLKDVIIGSIVDICRPLISDDMAYSLSVPW